MRSSVCANQSIEIAVETSPTNSGIFSAFSFRNPQSAETDEDGRENRDDRF